MTKAQESQNKPQFTAKHPDVILCKESGRRLYEQLEKDGANLTGIGVGSTDDGMKVAIQVYLLDNKSKKLVPSTFEGYEVKTVVTGVIRAL